MSEWESAAGSRSAKMISLKKLIPKYSYEDEGNAYKTDEIFIRLMVKNLRLSKQVMFNVIQTSFELHQDMLHNTLQSLKDEIDIFSDEVKARHLRWDKNKSRQWLAMLIDYDYRILSMLGNLKKGCDSLHKLVLNHSSKRAKDLKAIDAETDRLKKDLEKIVAKFKQRERICNISEEALRRSFNQMKEEIERGF